MINPPAREKKAPECLLRRAADRSAIYHVLREAGPDFQGKAA